MIALASDSSCLRGLFVGILDFHSELVSALVARLGLPRALFGCGPRLLDSRSAPLKGVERLLLAERDDLVALRPKAELLDVVAVVSVRLLPDENQVLLEDGATVALGHRQEPEVLSRGSRLLHILDLIVLVLEFVSKQHRVLVDLYLKQLGLQLVTLGLRDVKVAQDEVAHLERGQCAQK